MKIKMSKLLVVMLLIAAAFILFLIVSGIKQSKPFLTDEYYKNISYAANLEGKYGTLGSYNVNYAEFDHEERAIGKIRVYYPSLGEGLEGAGAEGAAEEGASSNISSAMGTDKYPMILIVNGSASPAKKYQPFFKRLASWGFIVVGNDDGGAGTGASTETTLNFMLEGDFKNNIDEDSIGIAGYSQGGAGALAAVTMQPSGSKYKAIFTGSAAYPALATTMGWNYDVSKINIPYFMTASNGKSDDSGTEEIDTNFGGVSPLKGLKQVYDGMGPDVPKVLARVDGVEHEDILTETEAYMTAWFMYLLKGDEEAAKVFLGDGAEILTNSKWVDVEMNL